LEAILLVVLAGFAVLFLFLSKDYGVTAALFPRVVASASLVFIALDILWKYFAAAKGGAATKAPDAADNRGWAPPLALQAGYIGLIYVAGFSTATLLYLIICPWQLRYHHWVVTILHAVLLTFAIVYTFHTVFHVRLPNGFLGIPW
jgi:hypothetical protein